MNNKNFKILNFRKSQKISQSIFAEKTGVSRSYIAQIERGDKIPADKYLNKIITVFKLDKNYFDEEIINNQFYNSLNNKIVSYFDFKSEESVLFKEIDLYYQRIVDVYLMAKQMKFENLKKEVSNSIDLLSKIRAVYLESKLTVESTQAKTTESQIIYLNEMLEDKNNFKTTYFIYHKEFYNALMIS